MTSRTTLLRSVPFLVASTLAGCSLAAPPDPMEEGDSGPSSRSDAGAIDRPGDPDANVEPVVDGSTAHDAGTTTRDASVPVPSQGRVVGYYPAWATYDRNFQVSQLPGDRLTHVNYAFANIENGRCVLGDPWADVQKTSPGDTWER